MVEIIQAKTKKEIKETRALFQEYAESLGIDLCFQNFDQELQTLPGAYAPPKGSLLLAKKGSEIVGCVAMRSLAPNTCEMKRLYVRPEYRSEGIGRRLTASIIAEAHKARYKYIRLDTLSSMEDAKVLYRSFGFQEILPYYHNPNPGTIYFELRLDTKKG